MISSGFGTISHAEDRRIKEIITSKLPTSEQYHLISKDVDELVAQEILGPLPHDGIVSIPYNEARTRAQSLGNCSLNSTVVLLVKLLKIDSPKVTKRGTFTINAFASDQTDRTTFKLTLFGTAVQFYVCMNCSERYLVCGHVKEYNEKKEVVLHDALRYWMMKIA